MPLGNPSAPLQELPVDARTDRTHHLSGGARRRKLPVTQQAQMPPLRTNDQIALVYTRPDEKPAEGAYPYNPNGSVAILPGSATRRQRVGVNAAS